MSEQQDVAEILNILLTLAGYPNDVLNNILSNVNREKYIGTTGSQSLLKHQKRGGEIKQVFITQENKNFFEDNLKKMNIPFISVDIELDDGSKRTSYLYRDTDYKKVNQVKELLEIKISKNAKELDTETFKIINDKKIYSISDLSLEEIYAFKNNISDEDIKYCITQDEENKEKYKIYATDKDALDKIYIKATYDITNDMNDEYKNNIAQYKENKDAFIQECNNKNNYVIVDADNPNQFILVDKNSYSLHNIQSRNSSSKDGKINHELIDITNNQKHFFNNADVLFQQAQKMKRPIVLDVSEFALMEKTKNSHSINIPTDFDEQYVIFKEMYKDTTSKVLPIPEYKKMYNDVQYTTYQNLSTEMVEKLQRYIPDLEYDKQTKTICFLKEKQDMVNAYIQELFVPDNKIDYILLMIKLNGRTPDDIDLNNKDFYILNPNDEKNTLYLSNEGFTLWSDGIRVKDISKDNPQYQDFLQGYLLQYAKNPVIVTQEEILSDDFIDIVTKRSNKQPVMDMFINLEDREKEELVNHILYGKEIENMTAEKAQTIIRYKKKEIHEVKIENRTFKEIEKDKDKQKEKKKEKGKDIER